MKPANRPTVRPTRDDRIYAAGLFDGEGSITLRLTWNHSRKYQGCVLTVNVTNTNFAILQWLQARWGGYVCLRHRRQVRPCGDWKGSSRVAAGFLATICEFSKIKRDQIENALAFQETKRFKRARLTDDDRDVDQGFIHRDRHLKAVGG